MKHLLLALAILAVSLGFCIFVTCYVRTCAEEAAQPLARAKALAAQDDFDGAAEAVAEAQRRWHNSSRWLELMLPHDEADEASRIFAALYEYALLQDGDDFAASCAELEFHLAHIRQMQLPTPQNIL